MRRPLITLDSDLSHTNRRGNAAKTTLIVLGIVGLVMILSCAGMVFVAYFRIRQTIADLDFSDPAKIRQVTTNLVDITIPEQFVPRNGSTLLGITIVSYLWQPTAADRPSDRSVLTLASYDGTLADARSKEPDLPTEIETRFIDFQREDREIEFRGRKITFAFFHGVPHPSDELLSVQMMPMDGRPPRPNMNVGRNSPTGSAPGAATNQNSASIPIEMDEPTNDVDSAANKAEKIWWICGEVAGKRGTCFIVLRMKDEHYNEEAVMTMLKSIR